MGLDMYLLKRTYVGNEYRKELEQAMVVAKGVKQARVTEVTERVGYWRKANQIHAWFVENACAGVDDCQEHSVPREKLETLLALVRKVLAASTLTPGKVHTGSTLQGGKWTEEYESGKVVANPELAQELLPTQEGFFFGGTDYDQWYIRDLEDTEKMLAEVLAEDGSDDFYYRASW